MEGGGGGEDVTKESLQGTDMGVSLGRISGVSEDSFQGLRVQRVPRFLRGSQIQQVPREGVGRSPGLGRKAGGEGGGGRSVPSQTHHCCELVEVGAQVTASQVDVGALIAHLVAGRGDRDAWGHESIAPPMGTPRLGDPQGQGHLTTWRYSSIHGQQSSGTTKARGPLGTPR